MGIYSGTKAGLLMIIPYCAISKWTPIKKKILITVSIVDREYFIMFKWNLKSSTKVFLFYYFKGTQQDEWVVMDA